MSKLNDQITTAQKFTGQNPGVPPTDHSQQMNIGLEWTQRQANRPPPPPDPPKMPPIVAYPS